VVNRRRDARRENFCWVVASLLVTFIGYSPSETV
jgi:hypothetical protein